MTKNDESECTRIYEQWHEFTKAREAEKLIDLYADDAVLETPLVMVILEHKTDGVLRGREEIKHFFGEGLRRRPDDLLLSPGGGFLPDTDDLVAGFLGEGA